MKKVLILRHVSNEGPGYLAEFLTKHGIPHTLIKVDEGQALPATPDGYAGLVFMGGTMSVNDDLPWIPQALTLIRQAQDTGLPVLGHCLGGQLIAKALGAAISKNPQPEFGWLATRALNRDAAGNWLDGVPDSFRAFHWHGETFTLPAGATRILESDFCANQGFVLGNSLALQCHIEMTAELVEDWIAASGDTLPAPAASVQSPAQMRANLATDITAMQAVADRLYSRWIERLG